MTWVAFPLIAVFAGYFSFVIRRIGLLTADSIFVYLQLIMALGSLPLLDSQRIADQQYGYILGCTLIVYMVVSGILHLSFSDFRTTRPRKKVATFELGFHSWLLVIGSIVIVILYFRAVGHIALFEGVSNVFSGSKSDITELRISSYSGVEYYFPGYVNQVKNALLPALVTLAVVSWIRLGKRRVFLTTILVSITVLGLLGTGQRGAFVTFVAVLAVFIYSLDNRAFPRRGIAVAIVAVPIVLVATLALGRSSPESASGGDITQKAVTAVSEFQKRIVHDNQMSAVVGFRYIYEQREIQGGSEWAESFKGVLPGQRGSDLSSQIFAQIYGSTRGTAPPSIWGSIYHNFGWSGVVISPFLLAIGIGFVTRRAQSRSHQNTLAAIGAAGTSTVIGFWVAGSPVFLLNAGIVVYLLLWLAGARIGADRRTRQPDADSGHMAIRSGTH